MESLNYLNINEIVPNPYQPRLNFEQEKLEELAQSIRENGLIQPIIVRKSSVIGYELLAGERRLRACKLAGLTQIPAIIKTLSDEELMIQAIIENLQRADLNPIEEAKSYESLVQKGWKHEKIAAKMGKSRPYISNSLRLLHLHEKIIEAIEKNSISPGHARLLLSLPHDQQLIWLETILTSQLSVRSLEKKLAEKNSTQRQKKNLFSKETEKKLRQVFGLPVQVKEKNGKGSITISFSDLTEYDQLINTLLSEVE